MPPLQQDPFLWVSDERLLCFLGLFPGLADLASYKPSCVDVVLLKSDRLRAESKGGQQESRTLPSLSLVLGGWLHWLVSP